MRRSGRGVDKNFHNPSVAAEQTDFIKEFIVYFAEPGSQGVRLNLAARGAHRGEGLRQFMSNDDLPRLRSGVTFVGPRRSRKRDDGGACHKYAFTFTL
jgi:hypothetical protein